MTIFIALASWNDYLFAFLFTNYESRTLPVVISEMLNDVEINNLSWGALFAALMLQMTPVMAFSLVSSKVVAEQLHPGGGQRMSEVDLLVLGANRRHSRGGAPPPGRLVALVSYNQNLGAALASD